jgi:hypothetical protein
MSGTESPPSGGCNWGEGRVLSGNVPLPQSLPLRMKSKVLKNGRKTKISVKVVYILY